MYILGNGRLITRDAAQPYYESGAVVIDGTRIVDTGAFSEMQAQYPKAEFIDARGGVIMPGLINAHTHIYSGLARGLSINGYAPNGFLEVLDGMWWNIDRHLTLNGTRASAQATVIESIKQGVTTIFDHHASFCEIPESLMTIADVTRELGIRACLCYETSDRDGEEKCAQAIRENADFISYCEGEGKSDMIKAMFGGHALFTLSDRTMAQMAEANNGRAGFHIHVAEGLADVEDSCEKYGCRPIDRLKKHGMLGENTILGHCIHLTAGELDTIAETNTMIVTNPESNMGNAVGVAPVLDICKRGILIGLGTDAYTHDMLESLKVELLIQRHNAGQPNVAWVESTDMLFKNNAKIASKCFGEDIGTLRKGAKADVIVMDYRPFTPFSDANIDGHMIFGMSGRQCRTTIIDGKLLMHDGELVCADEAELNEGICHEAKKLWGELNGCEY